MVSEDVAGSLPDRIVAMVDTPRLSELRRRVRAAMYEPPETWQGPAQIDPLEPADAVIVRKARAIATKLAAMPTDLWTGQLLAGPMTLETPRLHLERCFPQYLTDAELDEAERRGLSTGCFGHIVPDYPTLLSKGLNGLVAEIAAQRPRARNESEMAFLDAVEIGIGGVLSFAKRLACRCEEDAASARASRAEELRQMAGNLRQSPAGPARTFWQALQSVWLLHMIFHSTKNGNAMGRRVIDTFTELVDEHAGRYDTRVKFPCGVATFSWYVGIGQGLRASADGRLAGEAVSSNFSPALGHDRMGLPAAILSYGKMHERNLPAGGPVDLRLARRLVHGAEGTDRMVALVRSFVASGGNMVTLTVADTEELRAAQREPKKHESLRVRMGDWSAYFTMLSRDQQDHHIRRQEARS